MDEDKLIREVRQYLQDKDCELYQFTTAELEVLKMMIDKEIKRRNHELH